VAQPVSIERMIRSRPMRVVVSLLLIGASIWAFVPYMVYRVSSSAFVNAELVRVTAPITGQVAAELPRKGTFIERPTIVPLIQSLAPDRRHLLALDQDYAVATERAALARAQLDEITVRDRELAERTDVFRTASIERLEREIEETRAERAGCLTEARLRHDVGERLDKLIKEGIASANHSADALAARASTAARCQVAEARLSRLEVERGAAQKGVFLRDGENDAPYSQQQRDRLLLRRQELEAEVLQQTARRTQLAGEIEEEKSRVDHASRYDLPLPPRHVVWSVAASPGSAVTEGQSVLDLADCGRRFVVVELPERDFEKIKAGETADVRLVGGSGWIEGRVQQVRGSAARADERLLAAQVSAPNPGSISVEVVLPPEALVTDRNNFCDIGRLAEVRFQRMGLGWAGLFSLEAAGRTLASE
jgi:multidrug resistance efflux pump